MSFSTVRRCAAAAALPLTALLLDVAAPSVSHAQVVEIRHDNTLRVDGSRFFPIGLLELGIDVYPDWNERIRRSGANVVWDNFFTYADDAPTCQAIADSAAATGYLILSGSDATWNWDLPSTPEPEISQPMYALGSLSNLIDCLEATGGLLGFANRDEPVWTLSQGVLGNIDSLHVLVTYDQLKYTSPTRIVAMNFAPVHLTEDQATWQADIGGFLGATDVVMFANYPYPAGPGTCGSINVLGYPDCAMDRLPIGMSLLRNSIIRSDQPLWAIVQAFKGIPPKEMRWEAYSSIIHGATGVLFAGWSWWHPLGNGIDIWETTEEVVAEVASLHSTLARYRRYENGVQSLHPDVDLLELEESSGSAIILTAGRNGYEGPATISIGDLEAEWAEVLFEYRWLPIVDGEFVDDFHGYEAHVYRVDEDFDGTPPPVAVIDPGSGNVERFRIRVAPNPVTDVAHARYELPGGGNVEFSVYDLAGRVVGSVDVRRETATRGTVRWDGRSSRAGFAPAGVYFLRGVTATGEKATARIVRR